MDAVHPAAAFQQEPVELRLVLVRLAAEERLDMQAVRADDQPGHRGELVLSLQPDQVRARPRHLEREPEAGQGRLERGGKIVSCAHASTVAAIVFMAPVYTLSRASTVAPQPNLAACSRAPADSRASVAGSVTSFLTARA